MSGIALFVEDLGSFPAQRAKVLHEDMKKEGLPGIEAVYALVWPDYQAPIDNKPGKNRSTFGSWRSAAGLPLWAWMNCREDQNADAAAVNTLDGQLQPNGWLLDIEGNWTKGAKLKTICMATEATGRPRRASLAGTTAAHVEYDYLQLEKSGFEVEWQAYMNSLGANGRPEGPAPDNAVAEMYQCSFMIPGWQYRHRAGSQYGWGQFVRADEAVDLGIFNSFLRPGSEDSVFGILEAEWGYVPDDRILFPRDPHKAPYGLLMGRVAYKNQRVALNVTQPPMNHHSGKMQTWAATAASARIVGAAKRGVACFLAERASDNTLMEVARGAA